MKRKSKTKWEDYCRKAILDAVIHLLSKEGNNELTIDRIAREAGIAKGSIYLYFNSKKELLEWVKEKSLEPLREELVKILESNQSILEKLRSLVYSHLNYFDEKRGFFKVLLWDRQLAESHMKRHENIRYLNFLAKVSTLLEGGIKEGIFRFHNSMKMAVILIESNIAIIGQRLRVANPAPVSEDVDFLLDLFLNGILVKSAIKRKTIK